MGTFYLKYATDKTLTVTVKNTTNLSYNNPKLFIELYYFTHSVDGFGVPVKIGRIEDVNSIGTIDFSSQGTFDGAGLCFKFIDDKYNNSTYDEYIKYELNDGQVTRNAYYHTTEDSIKGYFAFKANSNTANAGYMGNTYSVTDIAEIKVLADVPKPETPEYPLTIPTEGLVNCTINSETLDLAKLPHDIIITANEGYHFVTTPTITVGNKYDGAVASRTYDFILDETRKVATHSYTDDNFSNGSTVHYIKSIVAEATEESIEPEPEESTKITIPVDNLENCTINITDVDTSNLPQDIILTANSGYHFSLTPQIVIGRGWAGSVTEDFTLNEDSTIAIYTYPEKYWDDTLTVKYTINSLKNVSAEKETVVSQDFGLITLYKPTMSILRDIPKKLYHKISYSPEQAPIYIDLSQAIISFMSIPLDIEIVDSKSITMMGFDIDIVSGYIDNNIYKLDFGTVTITGKNNVIDYTHTDIEIYLPFIGVQKLDTTRYVNKEISLLYTIDLFTGDFLATISMEGIVYDSFSGVLGYKIPYIVNTDKSITIGQYQHDKNNLLFDREPKIILSNNKALSNIPVTINSYKAINTLTGFNKIELKTFATSERVLTNDIDEIKNILADGIII